MDYTHVIKSLVSLEEFKEAYCFDGREDALLNRLLVSATATIEAYCMRRLCYKRIVEGITLGSETSFALLDYPVRQVLRIEVSGGGNVTVLKPADYYVLPDTDALKEHTHFVYLRPSAALCGQSRIIKAVYFAGYKQSEVPADLKYAASALTAFNYRHLRCDGEVSQGCALLPENVRGLLAPYKRIVL